MNRAAHQIHEEHFVKISPSFDLVNDKQAKLSIVLAIYSAQVSFIQEMRGVVERLVVGAAGLVLLLDGWLVSRQTPVDLVTKAVFSVGIVGFAGIVVLVIRSLKQRFDGFAYVVRRINQVMMVYELGAYLDNDTLYPDHWKAFGSPNWDEPIFKLAWPSMIAIALFGVVAIWLL